MHTRFLCLLSIALLGTGCNRAPQNKEAIQQAITEHVKKNAGIDLSQLSVELGEVKFEGNQATASVSFKPKTAPEQGMRMSYTLERSGTQWVVKGRGAGHGGGASSGAAAPQSPAEMPSGHPPVNSPGASSPRELPSGHPPVNQPPAPKK